MGDEIILTTKLGKRTYAVTSVNKISEMENSLLAPTAENCITSLPVSATRAPTAGRSGPWRCHNSPAEKKIAP